MGTKLKGSESLLSHNYRMYLKVGQDEDRVDPFLPKMARMALPRLIVPYVSQQFCFSSIHILKHPPYLNAPYPSAYTVR
jgi:hypothetical protein